MYYKMETHLLFKFRAFCSSCEKKIKFYHVIEMDHRSKQKFKCNGLKSIYFDEIETRLNGITISIHLQMTTILHKNVLCVVENIFLLIWYNLICKCFSTMANAGLFSFLFYTQSEEQRPPYSIIWIKVTKKILSISCTIHLSLA